MNLNAPTKIIFLISLILVVLALIGAYVVVIPFVTVYSGWLMLAGYIELAGGCLMKGA